MKLEVYPRLKSSEGTVRVLADTLENVLHMSGVCFH